MKTKILFSAGLIILSGLGLAFADSPAKNQAQVPELRPESEPKEFKGILSKLVRQDEYLDEAIEMLDTSGRISPDKISAAGLSLKIIAGNLDSVSAMTRNEFAAVMRPGPHFSTYANAIFSYSRKVNRKAERVNLLAARMAAANRKSAMRDAVSSRKSSSKTRGVKITRILEERKALDSLAADARALRSSTRKLNATSKWLYIAAQ